jgi:hypothetical protein
VALNRLVPCIKERFFLNDTTNGDVGTFLFKNTVTYQRTEFVYLLLKNIVIMGVCLTPNLFCRICVQDLELETFINK